MIIIDRYISKLFFMFLSGGLLIFVTLFLVIDALSMSVRFPKATSQSLINYYLYSTPDILYQLLPVACLMGTLFTLSTLNRNNELVALFASGMSLLRVNASILFWVVMISIGSFMLADKYLPTFAKKKNFTYYNEIKMKPHQYSMVRTDRIWYRSRDSIFNIKTMNPKTKVAQGLTLYEFNDQWDLIQMITAEVVNIQDRAWHLVNGSVTLFTKDSSFPLTSDFKNKTIVMDEELKDIQSTVQSTDVLSVKDLERYIAKNKEGGLDTISFEVGFYAKFAFAFSALIMTLLVIPFSISRSRAGGAMMNLGICLVLILAYWTIYNSSLTLGYHGILPPLIAAWAPNGLIFIGSLWAIRNTKK